MIATVGVFRVVKRLAGVRQDDDSVRSLGLSANDAAFWPTATLAAFLVADALARAAHRHPLVNPVRSRSRAKRC